MNAAAAEARFLQRAEALAERLRIARLWAAIRDSVFWPMASRRFRRASWMALALLVAILAGQGVPFINRFAASLDWLLPAFVFLRLVLIGVAASRASGLLSSPPGRSMLEQCHLAGVAPDEFAIGMGLLSASGAFPPTAWTWIAIAPFLSGAGWEFALLLPLDFAQLVILQFWCGFHMAEETVRMKSRRPRPWAAVLQVGAGYPAAFGMALATPLLALAFAGMGASMIGVATGTLVHSALYTLAPIAGKTWAIVAYGLILPTVFLKEIEQQLRALRKADLDLRDCIQTHGSPIS